LLLRQKIKGVYASIKKDSHHFIFTMSATNIAPEVKDKLVEHLNEMLSAENAAVDRLDSRIQ
jgi:hypothetical protein